MKSSTKSYDTKKDIDYVLAEDNNHLWQVAKVTDGKYEYFDNLVYLDSKYAIISIDNIQRIINLQTKQIIETTDKVERIVNDIAITYNKHKLIDLKTGKNYMPENCILNVINGDYFIIKDIIHRKYGLFDSQSKMFLFPPVYNYVDVNNTSTHALIRIEDRSPLKLFDIKQYRFVKDLSDNTMYLKGNYLVNDTFEVYNVNTLERVRYDFQGPISIYGDYAIGMYKDKSDEFESEIVDLKTAKRIMNKSFKNRQYDLIINGEYVLIIPKDNIKRTKIYNLHTQEYLKTKTKNKSVFSPKYLKDMLVKEVGIHAINNDNYFYFMGNAENLNNLVFFAKNGNTIEVYNPITQDKTCIDGVSSYMPLSPGFIKMFGDGKNGIFAPYALDKYTTDVISPDYTRIIDIGLKKYDNLSKISFDEDTTPRLNLVTKNLNTKKNNVVDIPQRSTVWSTEMVRVRKK